MESQAISTAEELVNAPLLYKGKVRELYDLGEHYLIVVTDRISAFDYVLEPAVPDKGSVLNRLSAHWFSLTSDLIDNHVIHADPDRIGDTVKPEYKHLLRDRIMVARRAERIPIECVVRGYVTGGGWRQYEETGEINGTELPAGLRKNAKLPEPIFTPSSKNDVGHDEDISFERMSELVGTELAEQLRTRSLELYEFARQYCDQRGIILADCKLEFGSVDGELILIDEIFTPDAARFWAKENYVLDMDIDSMDKEPVRTYLAGSGWDKNSKPAPLPSSVVEETACRYREIFYRLTGQRLV
ncbi:phosphoribosylaminoimidazolesuccinocarboxamide synthase [Paenibacillus bouchesdurhonensis]|uniref:phosphoribosylaminoimidazolesuccinocarboxamide synthase n=1 Tax=Paenibacillus bouchesdurhonensis TaxID=1870990 RepID=UPI000DA601E6|nr:phosphoribosylaminoimidazolesuccinocarboxamide synthase [Paenibacillus bouchesdurhonensis]